MKSSKPFSFHVTCDNELCKYEWDCNTSMKYYVNCPDCRKMVYVRHLTQKGGNGNE